LSRWWRRGDGGEENQGAGKLVWVWKHPTILRSRIVQKLQEQIRQLELLGVGANQQAEAYECERLGAEDGRDGAEEAAESRCGKSGEEVDLWESPGSTWVAGIPA